MYHIHITVIIAVPWQNAHWLTGRLIFVIDAPVEVLAAAAQGHSHDVEKGPEKSSKSKKEWMSEKDKKIWTNATASATDMLSCVQYLLQYSQDTVLQYHTVSQHHSITMYHPSESPVLSNKFHRNFRGVFASEAAKTSKGSAACAQRVLTVGKKIENTHLKIFRKS